MSAVEYLYHIVRQTDAPSGSTTEIRDSYTSLEEANAAARVDLGSVAQHESHSIQIDRKTGMVSVEATCAHGMAMRVYIEKRKAPSGLWKGSEQSKSNPKDVWVIMETQYQDNYESGEEEGAGRLMSNVAYESLRHANEAAQQALGGEWYADGFELDDSDSEMVDEENVGSSTKVYRATIEMGAEYLRRVEVEVQKLTVQRTQRASKGSKKRKLAGD
ncbi:hypothetical protein FB45DRAFT_949379 [Roridomyces roridus]|uniref:Uncharacterized protein n=1 Tax=Roridomyces roridus TaxID=1738132 RepID=A0AAD7F7E9_9AGAR|nr:hypothetical protein FB45DRAFT_949379 [Roridomyces roridus]